jgi:hypothetical protein
LDFSTPGKLGRSLRLGIADIKANLPQPFVFDRGSPLIATPNVSA